MSKSHFVTSNPLSCCLLAPLVESRAKSLKDRLKVRAAFHPIPESKTEWTAVETNWQERRRVDWRRDKWNRFGGNGEERPEEDSRECVIQEERRRATNEERRLILDI